MLERGHRVRLVTPAGAPIAQAAVKAGIPVTALPIGKKSLHDFWSLRRWLGERRAEVDVINTHSSTDSWLAALACATMRAPPPIVRTRHVSTALNERAATRWLYAGAAARPNPAFRSFTFARFARRLAAKDRRGTQERT